MSWFFAFLHHVAAFALVAAVCIEFALIREPLSDTVARKLIRADALYGAAAGAVLVVGLLRVFYFEKGAAYYFSNVFFIAKLILFAVVGLLSIRPTREFLSWRSSLKTGRLPVVEPARIRRVRQAISLELVALTAL